MWKKVSTASLVAAPVALVAAALAALLQNGALGVALLNMSFFSLHVFYATICIDSPAYKRRRKLFWMCLVYSLVLFLLSEITLLAYYSMIALFADFNIVCFCVNMAFLGSVNIFVCVFDDKNDPPTQES
jgi:hypothetical protein